MIECKFKSKMFNNKCLKSYPYDDCPFKNFTWNSCEKLKGEKLEDIIKEGLN